MTLYWPDRKRSLDLIRSLKEALDAHNAASRFVVYDGPHNWMPKDFAERAVAWLQLRAMVKGLAPVDKELIGRQFESRLAEAASAQKAGDMLVATRDYREIAQDFSTFRDVKEQGALAKSLAASDEFRKATKNEKAALDLQDEVTKKLGNLVAGISERADDHAALVSQLQSAANEVNREQHGASDPARKQAIERGLASAFSFAAENGQQAMLKKDYLAAKDMFQAGEIILPESAWASYLVATATAQLGEKKQAIQELKKALEKGMTNAKLLEDSAFDRIREEQGFKDITASLGKSQPK